MKTIINIVIVIEVLALIAVYAVFNFSLWEEEVHQTPTQQEYCINSGDSKQDCVFEYRASFVCQDQDKTKEKTLMTIIWKDKGQDVRSRLLSSEMKRCVHTGSFQEYTQLEVGKKVYDLNTEILKESGEQGLYKYILRNCTAFEKEEGLCEFYTRSYFEYVDSLKV